MESEVNFYAAPEPVHETVFEDDMAARMETRRLRELLADSPALQEALVQGRDNVLPEHQAQQHLHLTLHEQAKEHRCRFFAPEGTVAIGSGATSLATGSRPVPVGRHGLLWWASASSGVHVLSLLRFFFFGVFFFC